MRFKGKSFQFVSLDKPPLRRGAINEAFNQGISGCEDFSLSWLWFIPRHQALWNAYGPPDEFLTEVLLHVKYYNALRHWERSQDVCEQMGHQWSDRPIGGIWECQKCGKIEKAGW